MPRGSLESWSSDRYEPPSLAFIPISLPFALKCAATPIFVDNLLFRQNRLADPVCQILKNPVIALSSLIKTCVVYFELSSAVNSPCSHIAQVPGIVSVTLPRRIGFAIFLPIVAKIADLIRTFPTVSSGKKFACRIDMRRSCQDIQLTQHRKSASTPHGSLPIDRGVVKWPV